MKRKNVAQAITAAMVATMLTAGLWGCEPAQTETETITENSTGEDVAVAASSGDPLAALLPEELESITVGKLSPEHEFYQEVVTLDPECAEYINEISIYDKEIDDTFIVHLSLPPQYDENEEYPLVILTDGVWRLSDHPELRPMMVDGEIEPVILASIGYPNGYDYRTIRNRDLVDHPDAFLHFVVDNLVPYLEDNYSISQENMTLTGHSCGGYWVYYALLNSDTIGRNMFANYYVGSPAMEANTLGVTMYDFEQQYYERNKTLNANVYVTVGGDEDFYSIQEGEDFGMQLLSREYEGLEMTYEVIPGYVHENVFKPSIRNTLLMFYGTDTNE